MKKTHCVSIYEEIFIEARTLKECTSLKKKWEKKGFKAFKPGIQKDEPGDDSELYYHVFMRKETGGYVNAPPTDIMVDPILNKS
jgi:hypothetical protein